MFIMRVTCLRSLKLLLNFELEFLPSNKTHLLHSLLISLSYNAAFSKQLPQMQYTEHQPYGQTPYAQHQYHPPTPHQPLSIRPVKWHGQPQTMLGRQMIHMLGPSRRMIPSPFSQIPMFSRRAQDFPAEENSSITHVSQLTKNRTICLNCLWSAASSL